MLFYRLLILLWFDMLIFVMINLLVRMNVSLCFCGFNHDHINLANSLADIYIWVTNCLQALRVVIKLVRDRFLRCPSQGERAKAEAREDADAAAAQEEKTQRFTRLDRHGFWHGIWPIFDLANVHGGVLFGNLFFFKDGSNRKTSSNHRFSISPGGSQSGTCGQVRSLNPLILLELSLKWKKMARWLLV